jgi:prophage regulatory protein
VKTSFLRIQEIGAQMGRSRSGLYADVTSGLITTPIKLAVRSVGWPAHEIEAIVRAKVAGFDSDQIRVLVCKLEASRRDLAPSV